MDACTFCGNVMEIVDKVLRKDECPNCGRDLHCCMQCRFYRPGHHNDCYESRAERVVVKDRANFCDYFEFGADGCCGQDPAVEAKEALEKFFKI